MKFVYWGSTALIALVYFGGAAFYITSGELVAELFAAVGYPTYLIPVLIVVKIAAPLAILWRRPVWLSDLAYSGMFFHLFLAVSAHISAGDGQFAPALISIVLLLVSFFSQNAARKGKSPYVGTRFGTA